MANLLDTQVSIADGPVTITADTCTPDCPGHIITGTSTVNTITVESGTHDITLQDVKIDVSNQRGTSAFSIQPGAKVNLTLVRENALTSGSGCAGLEVPGNEANNAELVITEQSNDNNGSLNATGGQNGAGIGGGKSSAGGKITIKGGTVNATGRDGALDYGGAGIGGGKNGADGTFAADGNAFIVASSISDQSGTGNGSWKGVIFDGDQGQVYNSPVELTTDAEVPEGHTLTIKGGQTLTIEKDITLNNKGTITVEPGGKLEGNVQGGTINQPSANG